MEVQSLPTALPESFNTSDKIQEIHSAYSMTLLLEHAASSNTDPKIRERKLIHARVLGHLLREAPSMHATENVANQVNSTINLMHLVKCIFSTTSALVSHRSRLLLLVLL